MISDHLTELNTAIDKAKLLLTRVPEHGCNTDLQSIKLQSFILLTHSAIELFIESLSNDAALCSVKKFKTSGEISASLLALISSGILNEASKKKQKEISEAMITDIALFAENSYNLFKAKVSSNNGIRQSNLDNLLLPIGVIASEIDVSAYNALDTYASQRGGIAHRFGSIRTTLTKTAVLTNLRVIINGLIAYEAEARRMYETGMTANP